MKNPFKVILKKMSGARGRIAGMFYLERQTVKKILIGAAVATYIGIAYYLHETDNYLYLQYLWLSFDFAVCFGFYWFPWRKAYKGRLNKT